MLSNETNLFAHLNVEIRFLNIEPTSGDKTQYFGSTEFSVHPHTKKCHVHFAKSDN